MPTGERSAPVANSTSIFGYSPATVKFDSVSGRQVPVPTDDIILYAHDSKRLNSILLLVLDKSIHHLDSSAFDTLNNQRMFSAVMEYFNGQQIKDAHRCQVDIANFKINLSRTFRYLPRDWLRLCFGKRCFPDMS